MRPFGKLVRHHSFQAYLIILAAFVLRLWYWHSQLYAPLLIVGDEGSYYGGAVRLARGMADFFTSDLWLRWHDRWLQPPLYILALVGPIKLFGEGIEPIRLLQVVISLLVVALLYRLGSRLLGRRIGALTALLGAVYFPLITQPVVLMTENLFLPLLLLGWVLLVEFRRRNNVLFLFAAGVTLALATLTRTIVSFFIPVILLWLLLGPRPGWKRVAGQMALLLLGIALVIGPWALRNYVLYQRVLLTDTKGAAVLVEIDPAIDQRLDYTINPVDLQSQAIHEFIKDWTADPVSFLAPFARHGLHLLRPEALYRMGNADYGYGLGEFLRDLTLDDAILLGTILLSWLGLAAARAWREALLFLAWTVYNVALMTLVYYSSIRYRLPIVILLFPYALLGADMLRRKLFVRPLRLAALALGAALVLIALWDYPSQFSQLVTAQPSLDQASGAARARDQARVASAINRAEVSDPDSPMVPVAAGDIERGLGEQEQAVQSYLLALKRYPDSYSARLRLGDMLRAAGDEERAQTVLSPEQNDDSGFLDWAWDHPELVTARPSAVDLGALDAGLVRWVSYPGLVDTEQANWPFRWTQRVAQVRLYAPAGHGRVLSLFLAGARPPDAPRPRVSITVNGVPVARFIARRVWSVMNVDLPADLANAGEFLVTIESDPWLPAGRDLTQPPPEMPDLGIQLSRIQISDAPLREDFPAP